MAERRRGEAAAVIGASMGGMLAARVLANHYAQVHVFERDVLPTEPVPRKGVPQGRHVHAVLARGMQILEGWFPGLTQQLREEGVPYGDVATTVRWFHWGEFKRSPSTGIEGIGVSRPYLDLRVLERLKALPNVRVADGVTIEGLRTDAQGRVNGLAFEGGEQKIFDLVVDAGGRGSRAPAWLEALGYERPAESAVGMDLSYATCTFEGAAGVFPPHVHGLAILPQPPNERRGAVLLLQETGDWLVTQIGWVGAQTRTTQEGYLDDARQLPSSALYDALIQSKPKSPIVVHKVPSSLRRHYERLTRLPAGLLVFGDALCSLNPAYAQGISLCALVSRVLDETLASEVSDEQLGQAFFRRAAKEIEGPWGMATASDFAFPSVTGHRPPGSGAVTWFLGRVHRAVTLDDQLAATFFKVQNLLAPQTALMTPGALLRVLRPRWANASTNR